MSSKYYNNIKSLLRFIFLLIIIANSVSCSYLGLQEPDTNGQNLSKRKLTASDKEKYGNPNAYFFMMRQPEQSKVLAPEMEMNPLIKKQIDTLVAGRQSSLRGSLERGKEHAKVINQVLIDEGVPGEFIYLAMIESGYQTNLKSPMGAAGMWQFMKSTARLYGLRVDLFRDERKDIILSTIAAGRHLKDLYDQFKDWKLVLAAYNAGPGTVDRAIKRSGSRDFWALAERGNFRQETVAFVAKFFAINFIMANPESFGLDLNCLTSYKGLNHSMRIKNQKKESNANKNRTGN